MSTIKLKFIRLFHKQNFYNGDYGTHYSPYGRVLFAGRRNDFHLKYIRQRLTKSRNDYGWAIDLTDENEDPVVRDLGLSGFENNCPKYFVEFDLNIDDIDVVINEPTEILIFKSDNRKRYKIIKGYNITFKTDNSRDRNSDGELLTYFLTERSFNKLIKKLG